jgi:hypothetical protein
MNLPKKRIQNHQQIEIKTGKIRHMNYNYIVNALDE